MYYGPEREPLVFKPEDGGFEGLGGKIPGPELTVADVARLVGPNRMVDVIGEHIPPSTTDRRCRNAIIRAVDLG